MIQHLTESLCNVKVKHVLLQLVFTPHGEFHDTELKHVYSEHNCKCGRRGGLVVSVLDSRASSPGSSPGPGHCVVFLCKTLYSDSAFLHPGV